VEAPPQALVPASPAAAAPACAPPSASPSALARPPNTPRTKPALPAAEWALSIAVGDAPPTFVPRPREPETEPTSETKPALKRGRGKVGSSGKAEGEISTAVKEMLDPHVAPNDYVQAWQKGISVLKFGRKGCEQRAECSRIPQKCWGQKHSRNVEVFFVAGYLLPRSPLPMLLVLTLNPFQCS